MEEMDEQEKTMQTISLKVETIEENNASSQEHRVRMAQSYLEGCAFERAALATKGFLAASSLNYSHSNNLWLRHTTRL